MSPAAARCAWLLLATGPWAVPCRAWVPQPPSVPVTEDSKAYLKDLASGDIAATLARLRSLAPCLGGSNPCPEEKRLELRQALETLKTLVTARKEPEDPRLKELRSSLLKLIDGTSSMVEATAWAPGYSGARDQVNIVVVIAGAMAQREKESSRADDAKELSDKATRLSEQALQKILDAVRQLEAQDRKLSSDKPDSTEKRPDEKPHPRILDDPEINAWAKGQPWGSENPGQGDTPPGDGIPKDELHKRIDRATAGARSWKASSADQGMLAGAGPAGDLAGAEGRAKDGKLSLADPRSDREVLLAAGGPFKDAARSLGLKVAAGPDGTPRLLGLDGALASADSLRALRARILEDPRALVRRPDFFEVIGRDAFMDLKERLRTADDGRDTYFRHMAFEDDFGRDLAWSRSCDAVSGGCNAYVASPSYRKGSYVSPEDLRRIAQLMGGLSEDSGDGRAGDDRLAERRVPGSLASRALDALSGVLGTDGGDGSWVPWFSAPPAASGEGHGAAAGRDAARRSGKSRYAAPRPGASGVPAPGRRGPRLAALIAALLAAAALIRAWLKRRDRANADRGASDPGDAGHGEDNQAS